MSSNNSLVETLLCVDYYSLGCFLTDFASVALVFSAYVKCLKVRLKFGSA